MNPAIPKMMTMAYEVVENMVDHGADRAVEIVRETFPQFTKDLLTSEEARYRFMKTLAPEAFKHLAEIMYAEDRFECPGDARAAKLGDEFAELVFFLTELNGEFATWSSFVTIDDVTYRIGFNYGD